MTVSLEHLGTRLHAVAVMSLVTLVIHDADHIRQAARADHQIELHVGVLILAGFVPLAAGLVLVRRGRVRTAATVTAFGTGIVLFLLGFVHLIGVGSISDQLKPVAGLWGDTYWELNVDLTTWAALLILGAGQSWAFIESLRIRRTLRTAEDATTLSH